MALNKASDKFIVNEVYKIQQGDREFFVVIIGVFGAIVTTFNGTSHQSYDVRIDDSIADWILKISATRIHTIRDVLLSNMEL